MTREEKLEKMENILLDYVGLTVKELSIATYLKGVNEETYESLLFMFTGYRDFDSFMEEEILEQD